MSVSRGDLVDAAHRAGYRSVKPRLVSDWVGVGLLTKAHRHGLGQGRGVVWTWPPAQLGLFIEILTARRRLARERDVDEHHVRPITALLDVPINRWLADGGTDAVPTPQVKRAIESWIKAAYGKTPTDEDAARRHAVDTISQLHFSKSRARERAIAGITQAVTQLWDADEAEQRRGIQRTITAILDLVRDMPLDAKLRIKPLAYTLAVDLRARLHAIDRLGETTEAEYEAARLMIRDLVGTRNLGTTAHSGACRALLTTLGNIHLMQHPEGPTPRPPELPADDLAMLHELEELGFDLRAAPKHEHPEET